MASQPPKNGPGPQKRTKKLPKRFENFQMDQQKNGNKDKSNSKGSSKKTKGKVNLHNMTLKSILKQRSTPSPPLELSQITNEFLLKSVQNALLLRKELSCSLGKKWKRFYNLSPLEENFLKFKSCQLPHFFNTLPPVNMKKKTNFKRVSFASQKKPKTKPMKKFTQTQLNIMILGLDFQASSLNTKRIL